MLSDEIKSIVEAQKDSRGAERETLAKIDSLRKRVIAGETTGNRVDDYLLAHYHLLPGTESIPGFPHSIKELRKNLISLETKVAENQGKRVLASITEEETFAHVNQVITETLALGKVGGNLRFILNPNSASGIRGAASSSLFGLPVAVAIPVQRYAIKRETVATPLHKAKWEAIDGAIGFDGDLMHYFDRRVEADCSGVFEASDASLGLRRNQRGLMLVFGDDVETFFKMPDYHFWKIFGDLKTGGIKREKIPGFIQRNFKDYHDTSYVQALNLLGEKVPEEFQAAYEQMTLDRKRNIILKLERLTARDDALTEKINLAYGKVDRRPRDGDQIMFQTRPTIAGPTEGDVAILTFADREQLDEVRRNIAAQLGEAFELGMHDTPLTIRGDKQGKTTDVPIYIKGLAQRYEIPLPKKA